jgi:hypothetical protein
VIAWFCVLFVSSACSMMWCDVAQTIVLLVDSISVTRLGINCF